MSTYIDQKYLHLLSVNLPLFKRKNDNLYNFRCPYCGDSQVSSSKARGYVYLYEANYNFKCHNCGYGTSLKRLNQDTDPELYKQYLMERFSITERKPTKKAKLSFNSAPKYIRKEFKSLKKVSQLAPDHIAKKYVERRLIPTNQHYRLFYASNFYSFVNTLVPNKFDDVGKNDPRLVIPFLNENDALIGFQGRTLYNRNPKYITIMLDENQPKVFGLDRVDKNKTIYVVEGPIDSLFVNNSIAMAGADLSTLYLPDAVFVYDNEPRNDEILKRMDKSIRNGNSIVIWPSYNPHKDINDMIIAGHTMDDINGMLKEHTYSGLKASTRLSEWRKNK